MRPLGNETGRANRQPSGSITEGFFMSMKKGSKKAVNDKPDLTSAGVRWSEVPDFARPYVAWIDGRHGAAQSPLPPADVVPIPEILSRLPHLHEDRPRGSKAMLDAAGARARLRDARPGAWLVSPYTGWRWAKWPSGDVGWLPADVEMPAALQYRQAMTSGRRVRIEKTMTSISRRTLLTGLGSLVVTAPAIVRASSLMPVKMVDLTLPAPPLNETRQIGGPPWAGFVERLRYHMMDHVLKTGWTPERGASFNGGMSEEQMRRSVAYARRHGFLK
jgi:hypothetical protein